MADVKQLTSQDIERIATNGIIANFEKDKSITPICMLLDKDNKLAVFPTIVNSVEDKEHLSNVLIPSAIQQTGASVLALISEAWMSEPKKEKDALKASLLENGMIKPSEDPDRKEVIILTIETIASSKMIMWSIIREENEEPRLELNASLDKDVELRGRYSNLLTKFKPSSN